MCDTPNVTMLFGKFYNIFVLNFFVVIGLFLLSKFEVSTIKSKFLR